MITQIGRAPLHQGHVMFRWLGRTLLQSFTDWRNSVRSLRFGNYYRKTYWAWVPFAFVLVRVTVAAYYLTKMALAVTVVFLALYFLVAWVMLAAFAMLVWGGVQAVTRGRGQVEEAVQEVRAVQP